MPVTSVTASVLVLLLAALSINVSRLRIRHKVSFGFAQHKDLEVAIRAHGNTLEQALVFLPLLLLAEMQQPALPWLGGMGLAFVCARLTHSAAVFSRQLRLRQLAHMVTLGLQLALACKLLWVHLP